VVFAASTAVFAAGLVVDAVVVALSFKAN